jgi:tripartite-type tricarboxylate transporter receptor subunit TctC
MPVLRVLALLCTAVCVLAAAAQAQEAYPSRTVRLIVPSTAGGPIDAVARTLADGLKRVWPVPVVVENRPGAGTSTGAAYVAGSPPDGYTLLVTPDSIAVNPSLYPNVSYDPLESFQPIALLVTATQLLVVRPDLGVGDLESFIALAKAKQSGLNLASAGPGTISHLTEVLLEQRSGFAATHVPFKGASPAITALLGGHVDAMWVMLAPAVPHIRSGKLKPIVVTTPTREPGLPDVPTTDEAGLADFHVENWQGLLGPAGLPPSTLERIHAAVVEVLQQADVKRRLTAQGFTPQGKGPDAVAALIRADVPKWSEVVRRAGIRLSE